MTLQQKNVLLFDLDGTLVDSAPDLALAVNKTLKDLGRDTFAQDTIRHWVGNGAQVLISRALSGTAIIDKQLSPQLIQEALAIFLKHYEQCLCVDSVLYDGVKDGLIALQAAGFRLAIITNKPEKFIQPMLSHLGLGALFELCIGGDTLAQKKPDPAPLLHALTLLNVSAEQCVMIGDSKNDIFAAKAANIASVGLTYGYNYGESIASYNPDYCFDTFTTFADSFQR